MMFFIRFLRNLTKKDSVESNKYEIKKFLPTVLWHFFHESGSGFSGSDPDFWPIQTQEKKFDPDPKHYKVENVLVPQIDPLTWMASSVQYQAASEANILEMAASSW